MRDPDVIGRYKILARVGRPGGMGVVYQARDPNLGRLVAVKLLHDALLNEREIRDRFYREARAAANLSHPNIITIHDFGEDEGRPFIVMEFISGETLESLIARERDQRPGNNGPATSALPMSRKLRLMIELCDGLACAHRAGVVHRDIKPANLMVDAQGRLRIVDFGIARLKDAAGLTRTREALGTLGYMAPEQFGPECDNRADIFAAGAVIYELVSGQQAFPGKTYTEVMKRILNDDPVPLTQLRPDLGPALPAVSTVVETALRKDRGARYQNIQQMLWDLEDVRLPPVEAGAGHPDTDIVEAEQALERGDYEEFTRRLERVLAEQPTRRTAVALRRQAVEEACASARRCLEQGDRSGAERYVGYARLVDAGDPEVRALQQEVAARDTTEVAERAAVESDQTLVEPPIRTETRSDARHWPALGRLRGSMMAAAGVLIAAMLLTAWLVPRWSAARETERLLVSARSCYATHDWDCAIRQYEAALALDPGNAEADGGRARAQAGRAAREKEIEEQRHTEVQALVEATRKDWAAGDLAAGQAKLERATRVDPDEVQKALAKAPLLPPPAPPPPGTSLVRLADVQYNAGAYPAAIALLDKALATNPTDPAARALRQKAQRALAFDTQTYLDTATAEYEAGKFDAAIANLNKLLLLDPGHAPGRALLDKVKRAKAFDENSRREPEAQGGGGAS